MNLSKFFKLSPSEIRFRMQRILYQQYERWQYRQSDSIGPVLTDERLQSQLALPHRGLSSGQLLQHFQTRAEPRFFLHPPSVDALRKLIKTEFPDVLPNALQAAESVMNYKFEFLGIQVQYDKQIRWHADPVSGKAWPQIFYADIPLFSEHRAPGDIKHIWELNRHQYFIDLGKAYWLTGEHQYAQRFMQLLREWVEANPYNTGVNWTNALEHAYRALSWIWTYYFCLDTLDAEFNLLFLKSIYQHGRYIHHHLEFYSSPYNHLIGEATTVFFIGTLFPEFVQAQQWRERGWEILDSQIDKQFYADGCTVEQASFYHYATLGFYLLAVLLRRLNGEPIRDAMWERLERAIEYSTHLTQPNGCIPRIGDADDARPIRLSHRPLWDFRDIHAMGAALFERPDFKYAAGAYAEDALWLLGAKGYHKFAALQAQPLIETSKAFPKSGYYFMRTDWDRNAHWLCFDCGEQAAGLHSGSIRSAAHGHADALSVQLTAFGQPMLVDSGLYTYNGAKDWRDYFRETRAHNTIVVDGENQSRHYGQMAWSHVARARCEVWASTPSFDYVCGEHDGYRRLSSPVAHRRAVFFRKPHYWLIFDELQGSGEHDIESYFHLAPTQVTEVDHGLVACFEANCILEMSLAGAHFELDLITESHPDKPHSGWIGASYGCRTAAPVIRWHARQALPMRWCTLLALQPNAWRLDYREGVCRIYGQDVNDLYLWQDQSHDIEDLAEGEKVRLDGLGFVLGATSDFETLRQK